MPLAIALLNRRVLFWFGSPLVAVAGSRTSVVVGSVVLVGPYDEGFAGPGIDPPGTCHSVG